MSQSRRNFTKEFKEAAIRRLELGASIGEVARACEVNPNVLHRWRREEPSGRKSGGRLGAQSGPASHGNRFFAALPAACRRAAEAAGIDYARLVYPYLEKEVKLATLLPLRRLCELAQVSRAGFYRWRQAATPVADDMKLRDDIQRIALEFPYYGWRRVTAELRRRGWTVNHKRVRRIMREDNLLCLRRRKFVVTTDSDHSRPVYPNLAAQLELSGINQLWIADITLHSAGGRVHLPGGGDRCLLAASDWLGARPQHRRRSGTGGLACGPGTTGRDHWPGASFRPRQPVCIDRLHQSARGLRNRHQHES